MSDVEVDGTTGSGTLRPFRDVSSGYTLFEKGDLLVAKITPCFENGKIAQAAPETAIAAGSTEFHVVRPISGASDPRYILHYLRLPHIRAAGKRRMTGSGGQRRVPESYLSGLNVPLPPIEEQRRIAAILDQADELRAKRRTAQELESVLSIAILADVVGDPRDNRRGWPTVPLASVVDEDDRINYGVVQPGPHVTDGVPLIRVSDLLGGAVSHENLKQIARDTEARYRRSRLKGNEVLVSCVGSIGNAAVTTQKEAGFNIARAVARIPLRLEVSRRYVAAYIASPYAQRYFISQVRTVAQPTLNIKQIKELPLLLPPDKVQRRFDEWAAAILEQQARTTASARVLDQLLVSLQSRAFAGQL